MEAVILVPLSFRCTAKQAPFAGLLDPLCKPHVSHTSSFRLLHRGEVFPPHPSPPRRQKGSDNIDDSH